MNKKNRTEEVELADPSSVNSSCLKGLEFSLFSLHPPPPRNPKRSTTSCVGHTINHLSYKLLLSHISSILGLCNYKNQTVNGFLPIFSLNITSLLFYSRKFSLSQSRLSSCELAFLRHPPIFPNSVHILFTCMVNK